jgi:hypothetical protein
VAVRGAGVGVICFIAAAIAASSASAATYSNATPILDPSFAVVGSHPLDPYPSTISVTGEAGTITKATVTLFDVNGGEERDLDVLLVGPGGSTILMSDVCDAGGFLPSFIHFNFTFDDDAPAAMPDVCSASLQPATGSWKPTNYDTSDNFPGVAPPYPLGLANVRGTSANGDWKIYGFDDSYPDPVTINGGWSLTLATTGAPAVPPTTPLPAHKRCKKHKHRAAAAKKRCKKKRR